ncbi:GtrA family protein [Pedobacter nyackensis]|uniref:Putative flippase GtrA (Transmembrane translocase of bactoprenol-linked glucose) n=1 Tax=Pedobacter nyackensis TaxID=475255 RepID=A0A1W2F1X6_9SPHI|nr:GtrA family protein [Pedobacter nyackensis]SMD15486.1 Putative flippase GtrA (transmembrane translocase of bactoprenol-linked glucose) [Pedobacter nyackensis]
MSKKKSVFVFAKAQVSAFTGGMLDYVVMILCTELLHIHYTISIAIGGIIGAILNFSLNRYWTFNGNKASELAVGTQLLKFAFVVAGSIALKSSGTYLFTTWLKLDYKITRIMVDIIVSLGFNYVLQKYWVFRKRQVQEMNNPD